MTTLDILKILQAQYPDFEWSVPPELKMGILTTNAAFKLAGQKNLVPKKSPLGGQGGVAQTSTENLKPQNPAQIAATLVQEIQQFCDSQNLPVIVKNLGPYINLDLKDEAWSDFLEQKLELQTLLPKSEKKVILDYVGANVAKKLHAGHMRNLNIGDTLRRILKLKYPKLLTDNHWGDWGVTMGILIWGWKNQGDLEAYQKSPIDELNRVYVWANSQKDVVEDWENLVREEFVKLEQKDEENYKLWQEFIIVTKDKLQEDLDLMKVPSLDLDQGESFYEADMQRLTEFMEKYDIWQKEDLARYFDFDQLVEKWPDLELELKEKFKNFGRCYLISSKGYTTYCYRDIAARLQWTRDHEAELMITVTGNEQLQNFRQAFALVHYLASLPEFTQEFGKVVAQKMKWENLVHIAYGFLTLDSGKMSTRKGTVLTLKNLFEEVKTEAKKVLSQKSENIDPNELEIRSQKVTLAALKWYDLNRGISEDLVLDTPAILKFEGNTGVYELYTLARINSILEKNN